jgi:pyruvate/2-oxoglutarate dehydrogenase complex dihydrolipoamide acyltransferase (E2) component
MVSLRLSKIIRKVGAKIMSGENTGNGNGQEGSPQNTGTQIQPPNQTQTQNTTPAQTQQAPPFIAQLNQTLQSLPETIALAVREAMPQPASQPAAAQQNTSEAGKSKDDSDKPAEKPSQPAATVPGKKSFAQWWFGS